MQHSVCKILQLQFVFLQSFACERRMGLVPRLLSWWTHAAHAGILSTLHHVSSWLWPPLRVHMTVLRGVHWIFANEWPKEYATARQLLHRLV